MKLYKVTFETEIMILAEDENEAITNAGKFTGEEEPKFVDCSGPIQNESQLGSWVGCYPYSAKRSYNPDYKSCEDFL
jgi:hypothetical protein